jgi:hypothetical protein
LDRIIFTSGSANTIIGQDQMAITDMVSNSDRITFITTTTVTALASSSETTSFTSTIPIDTIPIATVNKASTKTARGKTKTARCNAYRDPSSR